VEKEDDLVNVSQCCYPEYLFSAILGGVFNLMSVRILVGKERFFIMLVMSNGWRTRE
jgi:hypothetical protein